MLNKLLFISIYIWICYLKIFHILYSDGKIFKKKSIQHQLLIIIANFPIKSNSQKNAISAIKIEHIECSKHVTFTRWMHTTKIYKIFKQLGAKFKIKKILAPNVGYRLNILALVIFQSIHSKKVFYKGLKKSQ